MEPEEPEGVTLPHLMVALKLKEVQRFTEKYIKPSLEQKLIRKIASKASADSLAYYKLTAKGRGLRDALR